MDMNYDVWVTLMHFATSKFNIETIECLVIEIDQQFQIFGWFNFFQI